MHQAIYGEVTHNVFAVAAMSGSSAQITDKEMMGFGPSV